jgi:dTDP-4-amino-4,6-dideoxygalactose transaminase
MKIPILDLKTQYERIAEEVEQAVTSVLRSQQFILGPEVKGFEQELASYCGVNHAIGCASGSDALLVALMACDVGPGDEVVTTPFSFFATVGSIVRLGAKPVFVDIDLATFNINGQHLDRVVTKQTKAILPVHLFGQCADMETINSTAKGCGAWVIEDAAQAIGAEYMGRRAGGLGHIGAFSFYPSKNLGGAGDGGALTTNDERLAERMRVLRAHGAKKKYHHDEVGVNSRLDSLQAAILRVKLRYLDEWSEARRSNARRYNKLFTETGLTHQECIYLPDEAGAGLHAFNQYVIRARERDKLRTFLGECGVGTEIYYPVPLHLQTCFKSLGYQNGDLPNSEQAAVEALAIPVYPELGDDAQAYIVDTICSFYDKKR